MSNDRSVYYIAAIFFFVELRIPGKSFTTNRWVVYVCSTPRSTSTLLLREVAKRPVVGRPAVQVYSWASVRSTSPCIFKSQGLNQRSGGSASQLIQSHRRRWIILVLSYRTNSGAMSRLILIHSRGWNSPNF